MNLFEKKFNVWLFVGILLACFAVSAGVRYQQFETWEQTPQSYFVGDRPMMTTLDAPYWLRWAREYKEGQYGNDVLRTYPSQSNKFTKQSIPDKFVDNLPPDSLLVYSEKKIATFPSSVFSSHTWFRFLMATTI